MNFHPTNDNRDQLEQALVAVRIEMERSPVLAEQSQASALLAQRGRTVGSIPATGASLRLHHLEMIATLVKARPPRIDPSDSLGAYELQTLAEHMQEIANAYCAYAMQVVREFAQHSAIDREEVEGYMNDAFGEGLGALFNAVEDVREWGRE